VEKTPQPQTKKHRSGAYHPLIAKGMPDLWFTLFTLALVAYGLVMVFSSTYYMRAVNADGQGDGYADLKSQLIFTAAGLFIMYICSRISSVFINKISILVAAGTFFLLFLVLFYHTNRAGDYKRWIPLPGNNSLQPSEIAKIALILLISWYYYKYGARKTSGTPLQVIGGEIKKFAVPGVAVLAFCVLVILERHLSATILLMAIGLSVMYINGANKPLLYLCVALVLAAAVVVYLKPDILPQYQQERVVGWKDYALPVNRNLEQVDFSFFAIASGGLFGKGIGHSVLKCGFLSEAQNDFIFAIVCEETGLIGGLFLITMISLLVWRAFVIAKSARNQFEFGLVGGIALHIALQSALHIAVVTGTLPNTGIGLPFVSAGGSSIVFLLAEAGLVLGVSRTAKINRIKREKKNNGD